MVSPSSNTLSALLPGAMAQSMQAGLYKEHTQNCHCKPLTQRQEQHWRRKQQP